MKSSSHISKPFDCLRQPKNTAYDSRQTLTTHVLDTRNGSEGSCRSEEVPLRCVFAGGEQLLPIDGWFLRLWLGCAHSCQCCNLLSPFVLPPCSRGRYEALKTHTTSRKPVFTAARIIQSVPSLARSLSLCLSLSFSLCWGGGGTRRGRSTKGLLEMQKV